MITLAHGFKAKFLKTIDKSPRLIDGGCIGIHGVFGSGKTHLVGEAIKVEKEHGEVIFANIVGEDGEGSAKELSVIPKEYRIDVDQYEAALELADYAKHVKARLLCIDSLPLLYELAIKKKTGGKRPPLMTKENNEWTEIHIKMEELMTVIRRSADFVVIASPSDLGIDLIKEGESAIKTSKSMVVPDMKGKYATGCAKWFDLLAYLKADLKNGNMIRELHVAKSDRWLTRQRLPVEITEPIAIPHGGGGWTALMEAIYKSYV